MCPTVTLFRHNSNCGGCVQSRVAEPKEVCLQAAAENRQWRCRHDMLWHVCRYFNWLNVESLPNHSMAYVTYQPYRPERLARRRTAFELQCFRNCTLSSLLTYYYARVQHYKEHTINHVIFASIKLVVVDVLVSVIFQHASLRRSLPCF